MCQYIIEGGNKLNGVIIPRGNKNAVLPIIAACLLTDEPVELTNVPDINDVHIMLDILEQLGADVTRDLANHRLRVCCKNVDRYDLNLELVQKLRASIFYIGALLSRFGRVVISPPGGCQIGQRQIDTHFHILSKLGAELDCDDVFRVTAPRLIGNFVWSDEMSVSATGNFLLASVLAQGESTLYNAASEPHIQDLCHFLTRMGAQIDGIGTNKLTIQGVTRLKGASHAIIPDHIEVGSFIAAAVVTNGQIRINNVACQHYDQILYQFSKLGVTVNRENDDLIVNDDQELTIHDYSDHRTNKIECLPWPGFPGDLLQITLVMATQCRGKILIHDKLFESRLFFVDKLLRMGADVFLSDPHRALVFGPKQLKGKFIESPDLRAGMALVLAALAAEGTSIIDNVQFIERGYEDLVGRLTKLGAAIQRKNEVSS